MAKFVYSVRQANNLKKSTGIIRAANLDQARTLLRGRSLVISSIKESKPSFWEQLNTQKVSTNELITFLSLMEGALSSGLSVKETLTILQKQTQNKTLQHALEDILENIEEGSDLSVAFAKHEDIFPNYVSAMIRAGEASGMISDILRQLTFYMEKVFEMKKKIIGLFIYPGIVLSFAVILVGVMVTFVVPRFEKIFQQFGTKLPPPTRILMALSHVVQSQPIVILAVIGAAILGCMTFYNSPGGKRICHHAILRMPLLGPFFINMYMIRIVQTLSILLRSGLPVLEALQIVQRAISNIPIGELITEMRARVIKGLTLSEPLIRAPHLIPPIVSYSVAVGEKNGNLPELLTNLSRLLERDLEHSMKRMASIIDPIMTMLIGGIVLFIALAIYLPVFDSMASMGGGG